MQQYQDDSSSAAAASTARQWAPAGGGAGPGAAAGAAGSGADDPGGNVILIGSVKDFERNAVHGLKLNGIVALEETSQVRFLQFENAIANLNFAHLKIVFIFRVSVAEQVDLVVACQWRQVVVAPRLSTSMRRATFGRVLYAMAKIPILGIASIRRPAMLCPAIGIYPTPEIPCRFW